MVTSGMIDAHAVRKNKDHQRHQPTASPVVWNTDLMDRSMNTELSLAMQPSLCLGAVRPEAAGSWRVQQPLSSSGLAVALRHTQRDRGATV